MLLLVALGTMNLGAMLLLTTVVTAEKLLPRGDLVARAAALAAIGLACVLAASPAVFARLVGA
jgi:predicted metal-binding membrane protein